MNLRSLTKQASTCILASILSISLAQPAFGKTSKPKKVRKPGTTMMVLGIVFTPIMSIATLLAAASYNSAKNYNCDWGRDREDGTADGERWRQARENCHDERESHMFSSGMFGGAALVGLGVSVTGIIVGAGMRSAAGTQPQVNLHYNTTGNKDWKLALNFPVK